MRLRSLDSHAAVSCAPCVIRAEVAFEASDERAARKLFVGATRGAMKLIVVAPPRAARFIEGQRGAV